MSSNEADVSKEVESNDSSERVNDYGSHYGPEEICCSNCGGNNVDVRVWVKANVFPVEITYHDWETGEIYCADCKDLHQQKHEDE